MPIGIVLSGRKGVDVIPEGGELNTWAITRGGTMGVTLRSTRSGYLVEYPGNSCPAGLLPKEFRHSEFMPLDDGSAIAVAFEIECLV
ncbi:MAG TPA: hypothetical protein VMW29_03795 [Candidatus Bathyarchaeia archaeon]|nr:hypothetical protein [Candidatus Bathyarchaeia archaeon]